MPRLHREEFETAAPLFKDVQYYAQVPYSVIDGNHPGTIFVDQRPRPTVALVCSHLGYYYLAGCLDNEQFCRSLRRLLFEEIEGMDSFSLFFFPTYWEERLNEILPDRATKGTIRAFDFNPIRFSYTNWRDKIPEGFCLKSMDERLIEKVARQVNPSINQTRLWMDRFISNGLGFCLLQDEEVVSICWSPLVGNGMCDISVTTAEKFRERGFATLVVSAFIDSCSAKGLIPSWHCGPENLASNALARKMEFEDKGDFRTFHCWVKSDNN